MSRASAMRLHRSACVMLSRLLSHCALHLLSLRSIRAGARESVGAAVRALRSCDALCCLFMNARVVYEVFL